MQTEEEYLVEANKVRLERTEYAIQKISEKGYQVFAVDEHKVEFTFEGEKVWHYPFTGWHTGKTIQDGRGIGKLLKQI